MRRLLLITTVLALAGGFVRAGDLGGRAILTWQEFETDSFTSDGFQQTYDARWERQLTTPFRLRLSLRAEEDDGGRDAGFGRSSRSFSQLQPGAEVLYVLPRLELQGTLDRLRATSTSESGLTSERRLDRTLGRLSWRPEGLPGLLLLAESRGAQDPGATLRRAERLLQATTDLTWRGLTASATARHTTLDDGQELFARESSERQGLLSYEGTLLDGRLTSNVSVLLSDNALDERATGGATAATRPVPITRATHVLDDTPGDDRDVTPRAVAGLVDGDLDRPAGVSLGPDSRSFQNVALDFGRAASVDTVRVTVRDGAGRPVPFGGSVRWDVYVSQDGARWNPLSPAARTGFTATVSHYEVDFDPVTTRFLKIVSFGTNSVDTQVAEVQALEHVPLAAGQVRHTDIRLGTANVVVTGRPVSKVLLSYNGLFNDLRQESDDRPRSTSKGLDHTLSGEVSPFDVLALQGRLQRRYLTQTDGYRQDSDAWSAIVRLQPLEGLHQTIEYTRSQEDNAGIRSGTTTLSAHVFARPYEALTLTFDLGRQRQHFDLGADLERSFVGGTANGHLTRHLRLLVTASSSSSTYGDDVPLDPNVGLPPQQDRRFSTELHYRASTQLAVGARFGWADTGLVSGWLQRYHLDWYPFPGGALRIGGQYDQDVDAIANRRSRRLTFTPAWQINRRTVLTLNSTTVTIPEDEAAGTRTLAFTLSLTL